MKTPIIKTLTAKLISTGIIIVSLAGCNSGSGNTTASNIGAQGATTNAATIAAQCLSATQSLPATSTWYVSGSISITNKCTTTQNLSGVSLSLDSKTTAGTPVQLGTFHDWWVNNAAYVLTFVQGKGVSQVGTFTTTTVGSTPIINAGQTLVFTGGFNLSGVAFNSSAAASTLVIGGASPTPTPTPTPTPMPTPTPATGVIGTYDFDQPKGTGSGIDYSGTTQLILNPTTTVPVRTLSFVSNVPDLAPLTYGNYRAYNNIPTITKSKLANGKTQYLYTYKESFPYSAGTTIQFPWDASTKNGADLYHFAPIFSDVIINGSGSLTIANICSTCVAPGNGKVIIGYHEQWSVYGRKYMPENIPTDKLNTIDYAFIDFATPYTYPGSSDSRKGVYKLLSADNGADYRQLPALFKIKKQHPYMKLLFSIGGWTSDNQSTFSDINFEQMTDAQQQQFAKDVAQIVNLYDFDGVDLDWEWWANHRTSSPQVCSDNINSTAISFNHLSPYCSSTGKGQMVMHSTQKYVNLLKYLRKELGSNKTLTATTVAGASEIAADEDPAVGGYVGAWKDITSTVDYLNIMAYDSHGAFDYYTPVKKSDSQALWDMDPILDPYYSANPAATPTTSASFSTKSSMLTMIAYGVPASKMVLGFPAYARTTYVESAGASGGLYQTVVGYQVSGSYPSGIATSPIGEYDTPTDGLTGMFSYKCVVTGTCANNSTFIRTLTKYAAGSTMYQKYGTYALTPWAYGNDSGRPVYVSYSDPADVQAKFKAACSTPGIGKLAGGMMWAISGDTTDNTSILSAIGANVNSCGN